MSSSVSIVITLLHATQYVVFLIFTPIIWLVMVLSFIFGFSKFTLVMLPISFTTVDGLVFIFFSPVKETDSEIREMV